MRIVTKSEWEQIEKGRLPKHIGLIMDGNGRWAEGRGNPRTTGHSAAAKATSYVIRACNKLRIPWVTFYAFSTENWKREPDEVKFLMHFTQWLWTRDVLKELDSVNAHVHLIGDIKDRRIIGEELAPLRKFKQSSNGELYSNKINVVFAINYGGRCEIVKAAKNLNKSNSMVFSEKSFQESLFCPKSPELDIVIRTGGDQRLSNFMLWQIAYAELLFIDTLWPDVTQSHIYSAMHAFQSRQRRYGKEALG